MCGIAAIYEPVPNRANPQIRAALTLLSKRGPDHQQLSSSRWGTLMAARLRVVDLAGPEDAVLASPDARYRIAYNGEVLNHRQLSAALHSAPWRAQTARDTEVVLQLVARYGERAAPMLQGQFAFVVEDEREGRLIAARDAHGICPLWLGWRDATCLVLASSPACLLTLGAEPSSIMALPQGHTLVWDVGAKHVAINPFQPGPAALNGAQNIPLSERIYRTVRSRIPHEVPYATIVGGLDSSLVTAVCASEPQRPVCTITIATDLPEDDSTDVLNARELEEIYGVASVVERIGEDFVVEHIDELVQDLCSASHLAVIAALMSRKAALVARSAGAKVVITGGGADEIFGGYAFVWRKFPRARLEENLRHIRMQTGLFECHREDASFSPVGVEPRPAYYSAELEQIVCQVPLSQRLPGVLEGWPLPNDKALLRAAATQFPRFPARIATTAKKALYESTAIDRLVARTARRKLSEREAARWYARHFEHTGWAYLVPQHQAHTAIWIHKLFCEHFPALAHLTPRTRPPDYKDTLDYGRYHPALGMPTLERTEAPAEVKYAARVASEVSVLPTRSGRGMMSF